MTPIPIEPNLQQRKSWWYDIGWLTLFIGIFFSLFAGIRPLSVPDEARYCEIPREMLVSADYVTPHLNTIKYFEKPVLFYWLQAGAMHCWGLSEWVIRLPTLLLGLLGCLITYATARFLFDRRSGWFASLILATSVLYFAMAHTITLDMTLCIWITACLSAFIVAIEMPLGFKRRLLLGAMYAFAALAMLTKGLVGILLPALIVIAWLCLCQQWQRLRHIQLISGIGIFLGIALPWHYWVQQANPEFFHFYFVEQQFLRYFTLYAQRYQPDWFFIPILFLGFFPWTLFLWSALRQHCPTAWKNCIAQKKSVFLLVWAAIIFIFFSLSKSKLVPYILPVLPPLSMLVGHFLATHLEKPASFWQKPFLAIGITSLFISLILMIAPHVEVMNDQPLATRWLTLIAGILTVGTGIATWLVYFKKIKSGWAMLLATLMLNLVLVNFAVPAIDTRSIKPLAMAIKNKLHAKDEVVAYHHYYQDLPFYLQRRITVVDCHGELSFGMQHQNTAEFMINDATFWKKWQGSLPVYAIMSIDHYHKLKVCHSNLYLLASTKDNVVVTNQ